MQTITVLRLGHMLCRRPLFLGQSLRRQELNPGLPRVRRECYPLDFGEIKHHQVYNWRGKDGKAVTGTVPG